MLSGLDFVHWVLRSLPGGPTSMSWPKQRLQFAKISLASPQVPFAASSSMMSRAAGGSLEVALASSLVPIVVWIARLCLGTSSTIAFLPWLTTLRLVLLRQRSLSQGLWQSVTVLCRSAYITTHSWKNHCAMQPSHSNAARLALLRMSSIQPCLAGGYPAAVQGARRLLS